MKISVVTVARNSARTIGCTVESFLRQTHCEKELLVIDGESTDDTVAVVEAFADETVTVVSEADAGMYDAANKGLKRFTGDAVGFLNADDHFHDASVLSDIAEALGDADIVFGGVDFLRKGDATQISRRWRGTPFAKGSFARGWMPAHPSFYVRRQVVDAVGLFDLSYRIAADYDWMLRACELTCFNTQLLHRTVVNMALGGASTASLAAIFKHNLEALRARQRWLGSGVIDVAFLAKPMRKLGQFGAR